MVGLLTASLGLKAQTWNGTTVPTYTTGSNITVGTAPQDNSSGLRVNTNQNTTSTATKGIFNTAIFNATAATYGSYNYTYNTSSGPVYGVYSLMHSSLTTGTGPRYAIYGSSPIGVNSWAGYFLGHGYFSGNLGVGTAAPTVKFEVLGGDSRFDSNNKLYIPSTGDSYFWKGIDGVNNVKLSVWDKFTIYNPTTAGLNTNNTDWNIQMGARDGSINTKGGASFAITSGNVGIGTATPVAKLQIVGNTLVTTHSSWPNSFAAMIRANNGVSTPTTPEYTWYNNDQCGIFHPAADVIGFSRAGVESMRIDANGNVAIGTVTPLAKLTVQGAGDAYMQFGTSGVAANNIHIGSTNDGSFRLYNGNYGAGTQLFKITSSGNVEVHLQNPISQPNAIDVFDNQNVSQFRVKATGVVYAREVNVVAGAFPDYVFAKEYKLPSIKELDVYIQNNHHLPGFESASHYEKNGINTSEMFIKQQEKIEELSLYIIELEKRLSKLETQQTK